MRISLTELGRRIGISIAGVGYSVERGEVIGRENDYQLLEWVSENFEGVPLSFGPLCGPLWSTRHYAKT